MADSIEIAYIVVILVEPALTMATDAWKTGWGCTIQDTPTGGHWTPKDASNHIYHLKIKAVLLGFQSFEKAVVGKHAKVLVDNATAVSCINQMGTSHSQDLVTSMSPLTAFRIVLILGRKSMLSLSLGVTSSFTLFPHLILF